MRTKNDTLYVIGFESHIMLNTRRKLFCSCMTNVEKCSICTCKAGFFCSSVDHESIEKALKLCRILECETSPKLAFYRKIYNYHDSLNGYQRSQHPNMPFAKGGVLRLLNTNREVRISHVLLQQDPAMTIRKSIDTRRAGNPLVQIVTGTLEGNSTTIKALIYQYLRTLQRLCTDLKISDPKKVLRTDLNISVKGTPFRYQIKNVTSFSLMVKAFEEFMDLKERNMLVPKDLTILYKGNLINSLSYSCRPKKKYNYLREHNHPEVDLQNFQDRVNVDHEVLLYSNKTIIANYFRSHNLDNRKLEYSFLKLYTDLVRDSRNKEMLSECLKLHPKTAYKKLQNLKVEFDDQLVTIITNWMNRSGISRADQDTKSRNYLNALKVLKDQLRSLKIPFTSSLIEDCVTETFQKIGSL